MKSVKADLLAAIASRKQFLVGVGAIVAACAAGPLSAQIVSNGSFEDPTGIGSFANVSGTAITDWNIGGNVDHIGSYWAAQDGSQSVDLNGFNSLGSLTQIVTLTPGQLYNLSFYLSGNPDGPPNPKTLDVKIFENGGAADLSLNQLGVSVASAVDKTLAGMNWTLFSYNFQAAVGSGSYDLVFQSTSSNGDASHFGPALDNVSITAIPEPEIYAMLAAGLGLMGFVARRRQRYSA